jgi:hypothetical protein
MTETAGTPNGAESPVTLWFREGDKGFEFNHLEDGHAVSDTPTPKVPSQKSAWAKGVWVRERAWLTATVPPKVLHDPQNEAARRLATAP